MTQPKLTDNYYSEISNLFNKYNPTAEIYYEIYSKKFDLEFESEINYITTSLDIFEVQNLIQNEFYQISKNKISQEDDKIFKEKLNKILEDLFDIDDYKVYQIESLYSYDHSVTGIGFIIFTQNEPYKILIVSGTD